MLALRHNAAPVDDDILTLSGIIHLKNNTTSELLAMQKFSQDQLKRHEQALRTATPVLEETETMIRPGVLTAAFAPSGQRWRFCCIVRHSDERNPCCED
jgi:hypothetical protein